MDFPPASTVAETRTGAVFSVGLDDGAATGGIVTEPDAAEGPAVARVGGNVREGTGGAAGRDTAGDGAAGRTGAGAGSLSGTRFGAVSNEISSMSSSSGSALSRVSSGSAGGPGGGPRASAAPPRRVRVGRPGASAARRAGG